MIFINKNCIRIDQSNIRFKKLLHRSLLISKKLSIIIGARITIIVKGLNVLIQRSLCPNFLCLFFKEFCAVQNCLKYQSLNGSYFGN